MLSSSSWGKMFLQPCGLPTRSACTLGLKPVAALASELSVTPGRKLASSSGFINRSLVF